MAEVLHAQYSDQGPACGAEGETTDAVSVTCAQCRVLQGWHYWLGREHDFRTLCQREEPEEFFEIKARCWERGLRYLNITIDRGLVTCPGCLEWLHA